MRSRQLESAITAFVEEAALHLGERTAAGEEVPFEIITQPSRSRRTPLYCYRPLTGEFIRQCSAPLSALPSYARALAAISEIDGLGRYLLAGGSAHVPADPRERGRAALSTLLEDVFDGQSDFELRPEHLRATLDRLQEAVRPDGEPIVVLGTLHGVVLSSPELALAPGLTLAAPDAIDGVPEQAIALDTDAVPHVLAVIDAEGEDPERAVADAGAALRDLVRALRLFGDGRIALGELGWSRVGGGSWRPLALGTGGRPRGMLVVTAEQEDELRAFCSLVARRTPEDGEVAWALERFHLGAERESDHAALTDYLLALRALLEPEGPASGLLAGRLAAICALPEERQALVDRVLHAMAVERAVIRGEAPRSAGGDALVQAIGGHLRALLRDVICGHLDRDLVTLADELLLGPPTSEHELAMAPEDEDVDDWWDDPASATGEDSFAGSGRWPRDVKAAPPVARAAPAVAAEPPVARKSRSRRGVGDAPDARGAGAAPVARGSRGGAGDAPVARGSGRGAGAAPVARGSGRGAGDAPVAPRSRRRAADAPVGEQPEPPVGEQYDLPF